MVTYDMKKSLMKKPVALSSLFIFLTILNLRSIEDRSEISGIHDAVLINSSNQALIFLRDGKLFNSRNQCLCYFEGYDLYNNRDQKLAYIKDGAIFNIG